jgi:phytoene dehydrogenase-like protein
MTQTGAKYDAVIVGAGHNGLVAACYLAAAGLHVLMLEKNETAGGATYSKKVFPGVDARLSVYSYLISLLPQKILADLGIRMDVRRRTVASYTPVARDGGVRGLLISNTSAETTRQSFASFTGSEREYTRFLALEEKLAVFSRIVWPTLLTPLPSRRELQAHFHTHEEREIWDYLVEQPLAALIEDHLDDDTVRGAVFTDAKIGISTYPEDPTLLQNRTFIYHIIGQGTGEWRVPVGGMGTLVDALKDRAEALNVVIQTNAEVTRVEPDQPASMVYYNHNGEEHAAAARFVLFNASSDVVNRCLPGAFPEDQIDGAVFKINMVLERLPAMKDPNVSPQQAFAGTFHLYEGYEQMKAAYRSSLNSAGPSGPLPGEMYCHSLTDPSILSPELQERGCQTLTLFGLDVPYRWFQQDNDRLRETILQNYLDSINDFVQEDIRGCLLRDSNGQPCVEAKTPLDLEQSLGLPRGNIFHGNLSWPFAVEESQAGTWGVETCYENIVVCGSSAIRGGAVSGIPGHNAAMKVLNALI